jgi:hypothetical protein
MQARGRELRLLLHYPEQSDGYFEDDRQTLLLSVLPDNNVMVFILHAAWFGASAAIIIYHSSH